MPLRPFYECSGQYGYARYGPEMRNALGSSTGALGFFKGFVRSRWSRRRFLSAFGRDARHLAQPENSDAGPIRSIPVVEVISLATPPAVRTEAPHSQASSQNPVFSAILQPPANWQRNNLGNSFFSDFRFSVVGIEQKMVTKQP